MALVLFKGTEQSQLTFLTKKLKEVSKDPLMAEAVKEAVDEETDKIINKICEHTIKLLKDPEEIRDAQGQMKHELADARRKELGEWIKARHVDGTFTKEEQSTKLHYLKENEHMLVEKPTLKQLWNTIGRRHEDQVEQEMNEQKSKTVKVEKEETRVKTKELLSNLQHQKKVREARLEKQRKIDQDRFEKEQELFKQKEIEAEQKRLQRIEETKRRFLERQANKPGMPGRSLNKSKSQIQYTGMLTELESKSPIQKKAGPPLYKQLEKKFQEEEQQTELERKKKRLEEIRNFHKPVDRTQMNEHAVNYNKAKEMKIKLTQEKHQQLKIQQREWKAKLPTFNVRRSQEPLATEAGAGMLRQMGLGPNRVQELKDRARKQGEKISLYAKQVKELHKPHVSAAKKQELASIRSKLDQMNRPTKQAQQSATDRHEEFQSKPWRAAMRVNRSSSIPEDVPSVDAASQNAFSVKSEQQRVSLGRRSPLPIVKPKLQETEQHKKVSNYLADQRLRRQENQDARSLNLNHSGEGLSGVQDQYMKKVLNDRSMTDYERIDAVKRRAEQMEALANREEQRMRLVGDAGSNSKEAVNQALAVNDIYIEAIQAKLKILDQI